MDASSTEIKRAARNKHVDVHSDRSKKPGMSVRGLSQVDEMSKKVSEAAEVLGNEDTKNDYDKMLKRMVELKC